jgi:hypothetical protein
MAHGVRLAPLMLAAALLAACAGQAAPSRTPPQPSASPVPVAPRATANPCWGGLTYMEAFSQRMADDLAALRPLVTAPYFDSVGAVAVIRRVSATLTAFNGLDERLRPCAQTADLAQRVETLLATLAKTVKRSLSASANAAQAQRDASVALFGLLPEVLVLSESAKDIADGLALDLAVAQVDPGADQPLGSLAPLPTSAPRVTPRPTPRTTPRPTTKATTRPTSATGWTQAAYNTAVAWQQSVSTTYLGTLRSTLLELASYGGCVPGATLEQCAADREVGSLELQPIKRLLQTHVSWMKAHPAAKCFRDAYAADRAVANGYFAWIADWGPWAGGLSNNGRVQIIRLQQYDAKADAFISKMNAYFSDCR